MSDGRRRPDLEVRLAELGEALDWPRTPEIALGALSRTGRRHLRRALLVVAAVLAAGILAAAGVTGYLGLRGATIIPVPNPPTPTARPAGDVGDRLGIGARTTMREASHRAGFTIRYPRALGIPDGVYVLHNPGQPAIVSLVYRPRAGLPATVDRDVAVLVVEASAQVDRNSFGKLTGPGTTIDAVTVNSGPGFWISGATHPFFIYSGGRGSDQFRLVGDVLIWNQSGLVIRIEGVSGRERALGLAASVR